MGEVIFRRGKGSLPILFLHNLEAIPEILTEGNLIVFILYTVPISALNWCTKFFIFIVTVDMLDPKSAILSFFFLFLVLPCVIPCLPVDFLNKLLGFHLDLIILFEQISCIVFKAVALGMAISMGVNILHFESNI